MEEEMEDTVEYTFTVIEIDLDYEFDAPRYFDFSCEEPPADSRAAETWFESAGTYPPSPFVRKLILNEDMWSENICISPKPKDADDMSLSESDADIDVEHDAFATEASNSGNDTEVAPNFYNSNAQKFQNQPQVLLSGLTFYNHIVKDNSKAKNKSSRKPFPRTSTLMKPTASHLAKQNPSHLVGVSRFLNPMLEKNETNTTVSETQANKRQKLEGGLLRKVADTNPQTNFLHKAPKRDGTAVGNSMLARPRLTIPREPDLETAFRAQKQRPKPQKGAENGTSAVYRFKARPLNRKIFEGPSLLPKRSTPQLPQFQEFHLKTSERAMQHNSTVLTSNTADKVLQNSNASSTVECGNREPRRPNVGDPLKQDGSVPTHNFKALPLNKKILSSRGDMGVFRNIKKEITVPMEFNFHTEKRVHHQNPPIELFNKLSLTPGTNSSAEAHSKPLLPACRIPSKGSKENRWAYFQQNCEIKHMEKEKSQQGLLAKQIQCSTDGGNKYRR